MIFRESFLAVLQLRRLSPPWFYLPLIPFAGQKKIIFLNFFGSERNEISCSSITIKEGLV